MRRILIAAVAASLLTACGGGTAPSSPSASPATSSPAATGQPTKSLTYTSGTAQVSASGAQQANFTAPLDSKVTSDFQPGDGFDAWWRTGSQALNVSGDLQSGKVDAFVRVELGPGDKNAYIDPWHTLCDVTLTQYDDTGVAGSFTCKDMPSFDDTSKIDVTGTFSATAGAA